MRVISYIFLLIAVFLISCSHQKPQVSETVEAKPTIFPDYTDLVLPKNIAPINFAIQETGDKYYVEFFTEKSADASFSILSKDAIICIPQDKWKNLLQASVDNAFGIRIIINRAGTWTQYAEIGNYVSSDEIDSFLTYRLLYPGYELWNEMGIYQRDLSSFEQTPIAENRDFGKQCINCHTSKGNNAETMMVHVRGAQGGTLIYKDGKVTKVNPKADGLKNGATYPTWHPSGDYIAFSANEVQQFFHSFGEKPIEVSDLSSDLIIYDVNNNVVFTDSLVYGDQYMETFPTWAPDGETLYFCRTDAYKRDMKLDSIRYSLYSVKCDLENHRFYDLQCVYDAAAINKSVSFPRVSPDGKYLMFTQSDYGNFSIWHSESDLYLMNLETKEVRSIDEVNSDNVDSFHTWSSTGKWFVFSSKRLDGLWARPYFSHFDSKTRQFSKPFVLPQENPYFYDNFTLTYNVPELIVKPVKHGKQLIDAIETEVRKAILKKN